MVDFYGKLVGKYSVRKLEGSRYVLRIRDFPYDPMTVWDGIETINPTTFPGGVVRILRV